jgi:membrane protein DedA with SNARE-associated domain
MPGVPLFEQLSYVGLFLVVFATGVGLPLPEDAVVLGAGWLVHAGRARLVPTIAVTFVAVVAGDVFLYFLGARVGGALAAHPGVARRFPPERLARARRFFERYGDFAIVAARFVLGVRAAVYFTAGALGRPLARFVVVDALAALVNVPALVVLGWLGGEELARVERRVTNARWLASVVMVLVVVLCVAIGWGVARWRAERGTRR